MQRGDSTCQVEIWQFQPICFHIVNERGSTIGLPVVSRPPALCLDSSGCATCPTIKNHKSEPNRCYKRTTTKQVMHTSQTSDSKMNDLLMLKLLLLSYLEGADKVVHCTPFSTLLSDAPRQVLSNYRPFLCPKLIYKFHDAVIFFFSPSPFNQIRVKNLLPPM